jgi:hypothetical protein
MLRKVTLRIQLTIFRGGTEPIVIPTWKHTTRPSRVPLTYQVFFATSQVMHESCPLHPNFAHFGHYGVHVGHQSMPSNQHTGILISEVHVKTLGGRHAPQTSLRHFLQVCFRCNLHTCRSFHCDPQEHQHSVTWGNNHISKMVLGRHVMGLSLFSLWCSITFVQGRPQWRSKSDKCKCT